MVAQKGGDAAVSTSAYRDASMASPRGSSRRQDEQTLTNDDDYEGDDGEDEEDDAGTEDGAGPGDAGGQEIISETTVKSGYLSKRGEKRKVGRRAAMTCCAARRQ